MVQFGKRMQADFDNEFGPRCSKYAQGVSDCKNNVGLQSGDPKYRKGYYYQLKLESEQAKQRG